MKHHARHRSLGLPLLVQHLFRVSPVVPRQRIRMTGATHRGLVRRCNEDRYLLDEDRQAFFLFDGAGGHGGGDVAADLAKGATESCLARFFSGRGVGARPAGKQNGGEPSPPHPSHILRNVAALCDAAVTAAQQEQDGFELMCTTLVGGFVENEVLHLVNVGDSRAYLFRQDLLRQLTTDHTPRGYPLKFEIPAKTLDYFGERLLDRLFQAIGMGAANLDPAIQELPLETGDLVLFCSDGLSDFVAAETICRTLAAHRNDWQGLSEKLISLALDTGGKDNVTVGLMWVE
ncbi:Serine/threonine-protein phosphatase [Sulfidibacter corallicola]|uniref:Serine/threonine-protein phosphatase n=1 Tax=Sulfidibacter corallicola TaxID=2818388 RepID=A0A8A4TKS8_SULCO|nr:protein phosphatase 2C domain-containing protein [Sulfidibacter corallicola]QTD50556.1 serine/threonine-protein phosphatase [Sulfidibacter corallicola]